jgi:5-methylcytosine-specific restriction endonuclease McrA
MDAASPSLDYSGPIVTRDTAKAQGLTRFFTGETCCAGHIAQRMVSNRVCCTCLADRTRARDATPEHRAKENANRRKRLAEDPETYRAKRRTYYAENAESLAAKMRLYRRGHPDRVAASRRRSYVKHYDAILARNRRWAQQNPEMRAAQCRRTYERNRAKRVAWHAEWRRRNREKTRTYVKRWRLKNREAARLWCHARRARKKAAPGRVTATDVAAIRRMQGDRCANPECRVKLRGGGHRDHIVPLALGGAHDRRNLQLLCAPCNHRKGAKDPIIWMQEQGLLL